MGVWPVVFVLEDRQGSAAIDRYRDLGGRCPTGRVSIRIPVDAEFENRLLTRVVVEHLKLRY